MKVNSPQALKLGRKVLREHGSWGALNEASYRREDGITVVRRNAKSGQVSQQPTADKKR